MSSAHLSYKSLGSHSFATGQFPLVLSVVDDASENQMVYASQAVQGWLSILRRLLKRQQRLACLYLLI
jgi:hypothetical protein